MHFSQILNILQPESQQEFTATGIFEIKANILQNSSSLISKLLTNVNSSSSIDK